LGELFLARRRWDDLEKIAAHLADGAGAPVEAAVLRARGCLARRDFPAARRLLAEAIAAAPEALWPRVILSRVLLQGGLDRAAAAVRDWPPRPRRPCHTNPDTINRTVSQAAVTAIKSRAADRGIRPTRTRPVACGCRFIPTSPDCPFNRPEPARPGRSGGT